MLLLDLLAGWQERANARFLEGAAPTAEFVEGYGGGVAPERDEWQGGYSQAFVHELGELLEFAAEATAGWPDDPEARAPREVLERHVLPLFERDTATDDATEDATDADADAAATVG